METDVLSSKPCNFHGDYTLFSITNTFESRKKINKRYSIQKGINACKNYATTLETKGK